MQGWLLEEMSKFTKNGVATPKYQIQNNFPSKKFNKNWPQILPPPPNMKLLEQADQRIQSYTTGIFQTTIIQKTLKPNYLKH